ncbi:DUF5317 domain-containing protein [Kribbella deserti]|uniref:DUF5317 domain-containing protein n=1 Tax=Kribbella deserti TaxID=1926257 RepID=A0ABV6QRM4_9ACTN
MLLVLLVILLAIPLALLTGGRLQNLASNPLTGLGWLAAAAICQLLGALGTAGFSDAGTPTTAGLPGAGTLITAGTVYAAGLIASAVCIAIFLRQNLTRPGVPLLALGFFANALVVSLNGAMPVAPSALTAAGLSPTVAPGPRHELETPTTLLPWLGDTLPLALPTTGQAISLGDLLTAAGAALLLHTTLKSHPNVAADEAPSDQTRPQAEFPKASEPEATRNHSAQ